MMNDQIKNIPELRFPEFEGEWVEQRLEKLFAEFKSCQNITASQIKGKGAYPVYGGNGLRGFCDKYTHEGDYFLIGRQGALCGNINKSKGRAFFSEHAIACKANDENNTEWLAQRLEYYNLNRLSESSAQPGLSVNKLLRFKLTVPLKPEQTKIANFLTAIDKRINLLQKKKAELEQYKKGLMQKLFSQEIRFKQDDGSDFPDWEDKKLGEVADIVVGGTPSTTKKEYWGGNIGWIGSGELKNNHIKNPTKYITELGLKKSSTHLMPKNTVVLAMTGATLGKNRYIGF